MRLWRDLDPIAQLRPQAPRTNVPRGTGWTRSTLRWNRTRKTAISSNSPQQGTWDCKGVGTRAAPKLLVFPTAWQYAKMETYFPQKTM